jgi:hypothetical protein
MLFFRDLDQLTNAAAYARFGVQRQAAWLGAFEEPPLCHQRGSIFAGKQTTPDSVRRKQVNRS